MTEPVKNRDLATLTALARAIGARDVWLLRLGRAARLVYDDIDNDNDEVEITEPLADIADALLLFSFPDVEGEEAGGFYKYDPALSFGDKELRAAAMLHLVLHPLGYASRMRVLRYALDRLVSTMPYEIERHTALHPPMPTPMPAPATSETVRLEPLAETETPAPRRRGRPAKAKETT